VESGWDLNEMRPTTLSLEDIFLQLTGDSAPASTESAPAKENAQ
jgi:hypothetical protein